MTGSSTSTDGRSVSGAAGIAVSAPAAGTAAAPAIHPAAGPARRRASAYRKDRISRAMVLAYLRERAEHLVGALDDLRVHLVGPLGGDQVGDLRDDVDVRGLQEAL